MTSCADLIAFADGELAPDRANAFRDHLRICAGCRDGLIDALQISTQISTLPMTASLRGTWWDRLIILIAPGWGRRRVRDRFAAAQALRDVDRLRGLIRAWVSAKAEWDACPVSDHARFAVLYQEYVIAERRLRREAGRDTSAVEAAHSSVARLVGELPTPEPSPDWQQKVLDEIDNPKGPKKED